MKLHLRAIVKIAEEDRVLTLKRFFQQDRRFWVSYEPEEGEEDYKEPEEFCLYPGLPWKVWDPG